MVLKARLAGSSRGVTLLELLVALSLTGLVATMAVAFWRDAGNAARLAKGRMDAGFRAQALFNSLCENLLAGGGVTYVGPGSLTLINGHKVKLEYGLKDSILSVNGKPTGMRVGVFEVEPMGPDRPFQEGSGQRWVESWDLDSLDSDRDGHIDFQELDKDRSGDLDLDECRFVAKYRVSLTVVERNVPLSQTGIVHPRNHATRKSLEEAGRAFESEGIPEF